MICTSQYVLKSCTQKKEKNSQVLTLNVYKGILKPIIIHNIKKTDDFEGIQNSMESEFV